MTRKISLTTAVAVAALAVGVPAAFGMPPEIEGAVSAQQFELQAMLDAREQALTTKRDNPNVSVLDQRERSFAAKREAQLSAGQYPDVVERAVTARCPIRNPVGDYDRFRIDHSNVPVPVSVTSSGNEVEWPQIGIGFGVGIVLMLGLYLALKATRTRPLAH